MLKMSAEKQYYNEKMLRSFLFISLMLVVIDVSWRGFFIFLIGKVLIKESQILNAIAVSFPVCT